MNPKALELVIKQALKTLGVDPKFIKVKKVKLEHKVYVAVLIPANEKG